MNLRKFILLGLILVCATCQAAEEEKWNVSATFKDFNGNSKVEYLTMYQVKPGDAFSTAATFNTVKVSSGRFFILSSDPIQLNPKYPDYSVDDKGDTHYLKRS